MQEEKYFQVKEALPLTDKGDLMSGKTCTAFISRWWEQVAKAHISYQRSVAQNLVIKKKVGKNTFNFNSNLNS